MIKQELAALNRQNLQKTYELEDMIDEIDAIKYSNSMFLTAAKSKQTKKQESYEELSKQGRANEAIRGKINTVLDEGKSTNMRQHPDVDFSKLNAGQRTDVNVWIDEIKLLQKEQHVLKRQLHNTGEYEKDRKARESQELYDDCIRACSKEIIKIHETNQLNMSEKQTSHSYLLELLHKKFQDDHQAKNGGLGKYEDLLISKNFGAIERHTQHLIYRTVKQIGASAKEEQKRQSLLRINVDWDEFQHFSPLQVIGLMLLRDDVNQKLKKVLF